MAIFYSTNVAPSTGAVAGFNLKTLLKAANWTVPRSSDGTTYNASGDQITSGAAGAGGMANTNAWFIVYRASTGKSFCFQRSSNNQNWRVKYSPSAGFTGGSPGATRTPSATDEVIILGGGTDASPTYGDLWGTTDGNFRMDVIAGSTDSSADLGGSWFFLTRALAATTPIACFLYDKMKAGTFDASDVDPFVIYHHISGSILALLKNTYTSPAKAFIGSVSSTTFMNVGIQGSSYNYDFFPASNVTNGVVNPWFSAPTRDDLIECVWGRPGANPLPVQMVKGVSSLLYANAVVRTNLDSEHVYPAGVNNGMVYINGFSLPFQPNTLPTNSGANRNVQTWDIFSSIMPLREATPEPAEGDVQNLVVRSVSGGGGSKYKGTVNKRYG